MSSSRTAGGGGTVPEGALCGLPPERSSVVTRKRLEGLAYRHRACNHQDAADGSQKCPLREPSSEPGADERAWDRGAGADREQRPVDPSGGVADDAGDPDPE